MHVPQLWSSTDASNSRFDVSTAKRIHRLCVIMLMFVLCGLRAIFSVNHRLCFVSVYLIAVC